MTEPNKIFRSGCEEANSYCDTSSSRHVKYKMKSLKEGTKLPIFLKVLLYILGFLLIAVSFTVVGLSLYPNLVGYCKRRISYNQQKAENHINDNYLPSFIEILSGIGICKESRNDTFLETLKLNRSKIESLMENENRTFLVDADLNPIHCMCPNSSKKTGTFSHGIKKENETSNDKLDTVYECICNETYEIEVFETNKTKNKNENYNVNLPSSNETVHLDNFHTNETNTVNENHYLQSNKCDCTKIHKAKNVSLNGTDSEISDVSFDRNSPCECPDEFNVSVDANETTSASEQHDYVPLEIRKCQCFKENKGENVILNGSELYSGNFDGIITKDNECICPETLEEVDSNASNIKNESKSNIMDVSNIGEANVQVNETEVTNLNRTRSGTEESDVDSLNSEKCECPKMITNEPGIESSSVFGVKTADGECICPEAPKINDFNITKTNGSREYDKVSLNYSDPIHTNDFHFNETDTANDTHSPEILEIDNFDIHETESTNDKTAVDSLNIKECVCPVMPHLLNNESNTESNKRGFKTVNGECVCPETLDLSDSHANETAPVTEKELITEDENTTIDFKDLPKSYEEEAASEKELIDDNQKSTEGKEFANDYVETVKEKELTDDDEKEVVSD